MAVTVQCISFSSGIFLSKTSETVRVACTRALSQAQRTKAVTVHVLGPESDPLTPGHVWRDKWTALQGYLAHKKPPPP